MWHHQRPNPCLLWIFAKILLRPGRMPTDTSNRTIPELGRLPLSSNCDVSPENDGRLKLEYHGGFDGLARKGRTHEGGRNSRKSRSCDAIRQVESGTPVGDLCRQLGDSDATFYAWKKRYAHLGVSELRRLKRLVLVSRDVSGQLPAGLSVGAIRPSLLVSTQPSQGSIRSPAPHSGSCPRPASVWLSAYLDVAPA